MKRFYLTCPSCKNTVMTGIDIYENRTLKCSCGVRIHFDLERLVLKECDSCKKNIAFPVSGGAVQKCMMCGYEQSTVHPTEILRGNDNEIFIQLQELLNKGIMTKVKVEKAGSLFNQINNSAGLSAYLNHINNYNDYVMYESEYNSAVRIMNETEKKMQQSVLYNANDELEQEEKVFSQLSSRFARLGTFKDSQKYKSKCDDHSSFCHKEKNCPATDLPPRSYSQSSYSAVPAPAQKKKGGGVKIAIGIAVLAVAAVAVGILLLGRENTVPVDIGEDSVIDTGTSGANANDTNEIYNEFYGLMHEQNYDLYSLNLYLDNLIGYNDADSIFEKNKEGFYSSFCASADAYKKADGYDIFATIEVLDGLTKLDHYKDSDNVINSVMDKNINFIHRYEITGDYKSAGAILLDMGDYLDYYTGNQLLKDHYYDDAVKLSEKGRSNNERIMASDLFECIEDYKDSAQLKEKLG